MEYRPVTVLDAQNISDMYTSLFWGDLNMSKGDTAPEIDLDLIVSYFNDGILMGIVGEVDKEMKACYLAFRAPYIFGKGMFISNELLWFLHPSVRKEKDILQNFITEIDKINLSLDIDIIGLCMPYLGGKERKSTKLIEAGYIREEVNYLKYLGV